MIRVEADRLLPPLMGWTILTGIFAWLPLVRIIGRPDGYTWGVLGLSGAGAAGPFLIFVPLTGYVVSMIFVLHRGPRALARPMTVLWHLLLAGVMVGAVVQGGTDAVFQGQGLGFAIPIWLLLVPFCGFAALAIAWAVLDHRNGGASERAAWARDNTVRLVGSLVLLVVALLLFGAGTNYNWVTALAIITTIGHWILLAESFVPRPSASRASVP